MKLEISKIKADLCVVGGGMAGINTAISAARLGVKTALVQERSVFGGNASGEIRMWVCGTQDYQYRETGLSEEINLDNFYYNPTKNYNLWNALLYGKVHDEENIIPFLNCTCFDACCENGKIKTITAYQMTTQHIIEIEADYFADCSGDSILAPLSGAEFMYGREGKDDFNEPMFTHTEHDLKTMGNSCLLQARQTNKKVAFKAPDWAEKVSVEKLKSKEVNLYNPYENFWYLELGGVTDVIGEAENINQRLLAVCLGTWDTIKNSGEFDADNFDLEFIGFLGAKRESRRMKGDYVLTANDIVDGRIFEDTVAYGGWPMDDHYPEGLDGNSSNHCILLTKPYGIPYRCLYSENVENLFFAGRNISATHMAMSSARVMGTCSIIGQAVGTACAVAKKYAESPRGAGKYIGEIQQLLLNQDCYLPGIKRIVDEKSVAPSIIGVENAEILRNGEDRHMPDEVNSVNMKNGSVVTYVFQNPCVVNGVKIVLDSDLQRTTYDMHVCEKHHSMRSNILEDSPIMHMPKTLAKKYEVAIVSEDGKRRMIACENENRRRNILISVCECVKEVSLTVFSNWGDTDQTSVFTFEVY